MVIGYGYAVRSTAPICYEWMHKCRDGTMLWIGHGNFLHTFARLASMIARDLAAIVN